MKELVVIAMLIASGIVLPTSSKAKIVLQGQTNIHFSGLITEMSLDSPSGEAGDFEVFSCGIQANGINSINDSTPNWNPINIGGCAGAPDCMLGIWSKFSEDSEGVTNTCSWTFNSNESFPEIFRYSGVDPDAPIISSSCSTGMSLLPTTPSINTEENAVVIRYILTNGNVPNEIENLPDFFNDLGTFIVGTIGEGENALFTLIYGEASTATGLAAPVQVLLDESASWRACSISLRAAAGAQPQISEVPTLSEWGLISLAILLGIVGFIFIERRKAKFLI